MPLFVVEKTDANALLVKIPVKGKGWTQKFLLRADAHHDNPQTDQELEKAHLTMAKNEGMGILDCGDLFCAMQGKYDKRSDKSHIRSEHQRTDYLDALVETAVNFYKPFAQNFLVMGYGNHELSVRKNHESNLTERLVSGLNLTTGSKIHFLGYTGWIKFDFCISGTQKVRQVLWYTHGSGGGGPVTEDIIQSNRQRTYIENADIMCSGHVHRSWCQEFIRHRLNDRCQVERREGWYVKLPTYKDGYGKGVDGFETERGMGPRPIGAWILDFRYEQGGIKTRVYKA